MNSESNAPRRRPGLALPGRFLGLALCAAVLGSCAGDNMFSGPNSKLVHVAPIVTEIQAPAAVDEGGVLEVRVRAFAPVGVAKIDIRYSRAVSDEKSIVIEGQSDTANVSATLQLPVEANDSILVVEATATDKLGRVSEVLTRMVRVRDKSAPVVSATVNPATASVGDTVQVLVTARDNAGLQSLGYVLLNAAGDTVRPLTMAPVAGATAEMTFNVVLPEALRPGDLQVIGVAVNMATLRSASTSAKLTVVDLRPPTVRILAPRMDESFPLSDSILVRVHVADSGGVAEVKLRGVAIRRDSLQNTAVVLRYVEKTIPFVGPAGVPPRDTTVVRYLLPTPVDVSETVYIVAEARDLAGNTRSDTVRIVDGPRVQVVNPADGALVGMNRTLLVNIQAVDRVAGLDSVKLVVSGVRSQVVTLANLGGRATLDTTVAVSTGATQGLMSLNPHVWNRRGTGGAGPVVNVTVSTVDLTDTEPPQVARRVTVPARVELTDSIRVAVRATDGSGSGIKRMGVVIVAIPDTDDMPRRSIYRTSGEFDPPLSGTPERVFNLALSEVYSELETTFPRKFALQVHAFAIDASNNCAASVSEELSRQVCEAAETGGGTHFTARGAAAPPVQVTATKGKSVGLPGGGRIADAVVDAPRRRVYLSNIQNNKVDIFHLGADTFAVTNSQTRRGLVGAAPWGLVISNGNDSLYVANSGGTNISVLPLDGPNYMIEDVGRRIMTPNVVLYDVRTGDSNGFLRYTAEYHDFSDRPQFLAQHSSGTIVYSTLPTPAARDGTLRYVDMNAGPQPEVYLLHRGAVTDAENSFALSHLDSLKVVRYVGGADRVVLYDRIPGTNTLIISDELPIDSALVDMRNRGSDVQWYPGAWNVAAVGLGDTTFVAASSDRHTIAFGEGARAPFGRVFLCCTVTPGSPITLGLSNEIAVRDLVGNAAERVFGVGLNANGTLGVARGSGAAYFFTRDLRLQGEFRAGMAGGVGGASLHPQHTGDPQNADQRLAFVPTGQNTIKVLDSFHYYERGEIHIRDNVVGPLRAVQPSAAENQGRLQTDPNYIVVKLIAVTEGANVVIIDVRRKDIGN